MIWRRSEEEIKMQEIDKQVNKATLRILRTNVQELAHMESTDEFLRVFNLVNAVMSDMFYGLYDEGYTTKHDLCRWEEVWHSVVYSDEELSGVEKAMGIMRDIHRTM